MARKKVRRWRERLLLLAFGVLVALLIAELVLRVYHVVSGIPLGADEEERCLHRTLPGLYNESDSVRFSPLHTDYLRYDEKTGALPKENTKFGRIGKMILADGSEATLGILDVAINNISTKNSYDVTPEPAPGTIRIAVLGDSFTWGSDVPQAYSYPAFLQTNIPHSEVLNFGMQGVGIDTMYLRWNYEVLPLKPNVTIFTVYFDDVRRAQACAHKPTLRAVNGQVVVANQPPPPLEELAKRPVPMVWSALFSDLRYWWHYRHGFLQTQYQEQMPLFSAMIDEMQRVSTKNNQTFIVVLIDERNTALPYWQGEREAIAAETALLRSKNVSLVIASEVFRQENHTISNFDKPVQHFLPDTNAYLARGVAKVVSANGYPIIPAYRVEYDSSRKVIVLIQANDSTQRTVVTPYDVYLNGTIVTAQVFPEALAPKP